jgi:type III restriction enzyme
LVDDVLKDKKMIVRKAIVDGQKIYEKSPEFSIILKEQNLPVEQVKRQLKIFLQPIQTLMFRKPKRKKRKRKFS